MKKKTEEEIIMIDNPLKSIYERYFWCDGFPTISEHDNDEVIKNFLAMVRRETGVRVPRSMVVGVPDWDVFKGPKDITKYRKKPRLVEQALLEDSEQSNNNEAESGAEGSASENREETEAAQRALQAKQERRSKKRNERPSDKSQVAARPAKKPRTKAAKPSKISTTNTCSTSIAQGSKTPPTISQQHQIPPTIDTTKPVSMILPGQQKQTLLVHSSPSSLSASSDSTPSEYSIDTAAAIRASTRHTNKKKQKAAQTVQISSEEDIHVDTSHLEQEHIHAHSLDHLTPHLSRDAFMHSNLDSPNHPINKFVNTALNTPIDEPIFNELPYTPVQASVVDDTVPEQDNTPTPIQTEQHTLFESQPQDP
jgi:hypothetical protein